MLEMITATRFYKSMTSGRTKPSLLSCIDNDSKDIDVITKFSNGCDRGVNTLATEAIAALLGTDLGLPIPEPFLVKVDQDFIDLIPENLIRQQISNSVPIGFGSRQLPPGYSSWLATQSIPAGIMQLAAEIIAFDGLIQNTDRRIANPNCLSDGKNLAIFDHDLAFVIDGVVFWKPPWETGGLDGLINSQHIFFKNLKGSNINLDRMEKAWKSITDKRVNDYKKSLPAEWLTDLSKICETINYIKNVRDNIENSLAEVKRLLL